MARRPSRPVPRWWHERHLRRLRHRVNVRPPVTRQAVDGLVLDDPVRRPLRGLHVVEATPVADSRNLGEVLLHVRRDRRRGRGLRRGFHRRRLLWRLPGAAAAKTTTAANVSIPRRPDESMMATSV